MALATAVLTGPAEAWAAASEAAQSPVRTGDERDAFDLLVGLAQIVTAISVPLLVVQISRTRHEGRAERTRAFQERYFDPGFQDSASVTIAFLTVVDAADCVEKIRAWEQRLHAGEKCLPRTPPRRAWAAPRASVSDVEHVFGFFEDFATAFNRGDLAKGVVLDSFSTIPTQILTTGWWYVCWRRGGKLLGEDEVWGQFERMVKELRERQPSLLGMRPEPSVRVLCLPRDAEDADAETWRRSRELSTALSRHADSLDALCDELGLFGPPAEDRPRWQVIPIPADIDRQPDAAWRAHREHAERIAAWLAGLNQARGLDRAIDRLNAL
jgi:hypothetical protein